MSLNHIPPQKRALGFAFYVASYVSERSLQASGYTVHYAVPVLLTALIIGYVAQNVNSDTDNLIYLRRASCVCASCPHRGYNQIEHVAT